MQRILVIRESDKFSRILAENGYDVLNLPIIETKPLEDLRDFEAKLKTAAKYDGIFVTSKNAAQILIEKLGELNINFAGKIYVLGRRGFEILQSRNLDSVFFETANTAEEMLEKIPADELTNKNFLFVRGEKSLRTIPKFVSRLAAIDSAIVYANEPILIETNAIRKISAAIERSEIKAVCFFSPSGAESFIEQFGAGVLHQTRIATIGKTTADYIERRNLKVDFISPKATTEDFAINLIIFLGKNG